MFDFGSRENMYLHWLTLQQVLKKDNGKDQHREANNKKLLFFKNIFKYLFI